MTNTKHSSLSVLIVLAATFLKVVGCSNHQPEQARQHENSRHSEHSQKEGKHDRTKPENQVAVLTVWADADEFEQTVSFYKDTLGLRSVGSGPKQHILDTDGTFLVIMEGQLDPPQNTSKRWPMFALTVPNLNKSMESLKDSEIELPWGVEEFGTLRPSSRYVMFYDPAGNLIELVEWL
jgi:catechol 2,3-dioxygenase-like lactoylglutathione lyase family enzyme